MAWQYAIGKNPLFAALRKAEGSERHNLIKRGSGKGPPCQCMTFPWGEDTQRE